MISDDEITRRIREKVPALADIVGPHTAMGELVLTLRDLRQAENPEYSHLLRWTIELVEALALAPAGSSAQAVVLASFFDNLHHLGSDCQRVLRSIGPSTRSLVPDYERRTGKLCPP